MLNISLNHLATPSIGNAEFVVDWKGFATATRTKGD